MIDPDYLNFCDGFSVPISVSWVKGARNKYLG